MLCHNNKKGAFKKKTNIEQPLQQHPQAITVINLEAQDPISKIHLSILIAEEIDNIMQIEDIEQEAMNALREESKALRAKGKKEDILGAPPKRMTDVVGPSSRKTPTKDSKEEV